MEGDLINFLMLGLLIVLSCVILWFERIRRAISRQRHRERARISLMHFKRMQGIEDVASPDHSIIAWTPKEREALGVNDTIELIDRIDKELGREYAENRRTPPEHVTMTNQEAS